jgi:hypothetical protein
VARRCTAPATPRARSSTRDRRYLRHAAAPWPRRRRDDSQHLRPELARRPGAEAAEGLGRVTATTIPIEAISHELLPSGNSSFPRNNGGGGNRTRATFPVVHAACDAAASPRSRYVSDEAQPSDPAPPPREGPHLTPATESRSTCRHAHAPLTFRPRTSAASSARLLARRRTITPDPAGWSVRRRSCATPTTRWRTSASPSGCAVSGRSPRASAGRSDCRRLPGREVGAHARRGADLEDEAADLNPRDNLAAEVHGEAASSRRGATRST